MLAWLGSRLVKLDAQLQRRLGLPSWVSLVGLTEHVIAGRVIKAAVNPVCSSFGAVVVVVIAAFIHEQAQGGFSDLRRAPAGQPANGAPLNGILDLATFLLGALIP